MEIPSYVLRGNAYERGFLHGSLAKKQVKTSIKNYFDMFLSKNKVTADMARYIGKKFEKDIEAYAPEYTEEMKGIADGAEEPYENILAINVRSEILFADMSGINGECTCFAVLPQASAEGKTFLGQSWDFNVIQREALAVFKIYQENKPDILMITEGGLIGGKGMNSAGVGLALTALSGGKAPLSGVPLHIRMRGALDGKNMNTAYNRLVEGKIPCAAAVTLASGDGTALCAELFQNDLDVVMPSGGVLTHTNHCFTERFKQKDGFMKLGSTFIRLCRIDELLKGKRGIDVNYLQEALRDHSGYPDSICMHPDEDFAPIDRLATNYAVIFDLTDKVCYLCSGNPCEGEFKKLQL